jgi:hypothetical protein
MVVTVTRLVIHNDHLNPNLLSDSQSVSARGMLCGLVSFIGRRHNGGMSKTEAKELDGGHQLHIVYSLQTLCMLIRKTTLLQRFTQCGLCIHISFWLSCAQYSQIDICGIGSNAASESTLNHDVAGFS